jgi:hypothetical protein
LWLHVHNASPPAFFSLFITRSQNLAPLDDPEALKAMIAEMRSPSAALKAEVAALKGGADRRHLPSHYPVIIDCGPLCRLKAAGAQCE